MLPCEKMLGLSLIALRAFHRECISAFPSLGNHVAIDGQAMATHDRDTTLQGGHMADCNSLSPLSYLPLPLTLPLSPPFLDLSLPHWATPEAGTISVDLLELSL